MSKKKTQQKMSLSDFHTTVSANIDSWADDVDEEELPSQPAAAALEYGYNTKEPSRTTTHGQVQHSTTRNPPRPPSKEIPNKAPFLIFVGSLSFETNAQDIDLLFKDQDLMEIKMIKDQDGRSKGFAYVTFKTKESLVQSLQFDGELLNGRHLRIDIADAPNQNGGQGRYEHRESVADNENDWRSKSSSGQSVFQSNTGNRDEKTASSTWGSSKPRQQPDYMAQSAGERKRVLLQARTAPPKVLDIKPEPKETPTSMKESDSSATLIIDEEVKKPAVNPFGAAVPRDEAKYQEQALKRQEEKKEQKEEDHHQKEDQINKSIAKSVVNPFGGAVPRDDTKITEEFEKRQEEKRISIVNKENAQAEKLSEAASKMSSIYKDDGKKENEVKATIADTASSWRSQHQPVKTQIAADTKATETVSNIPSVRKPLVLTKKEVQTNEVKSITTANVYDILGEAM